MVAKVVPIARCRERRPTPLEAALFARLSRHDLLSLVDLCTVAMDAAVEVGNVPAERLARALWNRVWDELDRRGVVAGEVSQ